MASRRAGKGKGQKVPPTGELRQSQVLTTFGPGSMLDLPDYSVLVGGLEFWSGDKARIYEERLEAKLQADLERPDLKLFAPPVDDGEPGAKKTGIDVFEFPTWFLAQVKDKIHVDATGRVYRTRPLVPASRLVNHKYWSADRKAVPVVPVRFVQACPRGHISDIDWHAFVNDRRDPDRSGPLWLDEGGAGNDFSEIFVRDEKSGARRPLSNAAIPDGKVLGYCDGRQPWLGPKVWEKCDRPNRLLVRSASNAYFAQRIGVISIPDADETLKDAVGLVYEDFLQYCDSSEDIAHERKKAKVESALEGLSDDAVWAEVKRRKAGLQAPIKGIKQAEIETLLSQKTSLGDDKPEGDFYARTAKLGDLSPAADGKVERLVLVHRLREVIAQVGFTRFEAAVPTADGELDLGVELAPLARDVPWLPAYQNRGEGVFLAFKPEAIDAWRSRKAVQARGEQLLNGFEAWKKLRNGKYEFPGLPYIMLHSLSHLLVTALSLDCGYSASAIRERVYASDSGYGILLYTGTTGSEGTLGGLVEVGRDIGAHLQRALELGALCSNDPVCADHAPDNQLEERWLHGAACHGCLLIAETSCEQRNELLDRALVVPTVSTPGAAFFVEPA